MSIKPFVACNHPAILTKSQPVENIEDSSVQQVIIDLKDTLIDQQQQGHGVGLAAVQIGIPLAIFAISIPEHRAHIHQMDKGYPLTIYINPVITPLSDNKVPGREGCFSFPGLVSNTVKRYQQIRFQALAQTGQPVDFIAENFVPRVLQHETDHCNGLAYLNHLDHNLEDILAWAKASSNCEKVAKLNNSLEQLDPAIFPLEHCQRNDAALLKWLNQQLRR